MTRSTAVATRVGPALARRQATWIAAMEPWCGMGYKSAVLSRWLGAMARTGAVFGVADHNAELLGIVVVKPDVLLGDFIALLAVAPEAAARGVGRALCTHVEKRTFRTRRWLYTSSDSGNAAAAKFYRKLGFGRVGRLPDLVIPGRTEILWRKGRP